MLLFKWFYNISGGAAGRPSTDDETAWFGRSCSIGAEE